MTKKHKMRTPNKRITNQYLINEKIGRNAFLDVMKEYNPDQVVTIEFAEDDYAVWDAKMRTEDRRSGKMTDVLIEIKVRNRAYSTMVLEKKKLDNLLQYAEDNDLENVKILYVNICPENTYMFNVTTLDTRLTAVEGYYNKNTVRSNAKVVKKMYYIPLPTGKKYPYVLDRKEMLDRIHNKH